jgi:hypothetical protein
LPCIFRHWLYASAGCVLDGTMQPLRHGHRKLAGEGFTFLQCRSSIHCVFDPCKHLSARTPVTRYIVESPTNGVGNVVLAWLAERREVAVGLQPIDDGDAIGQPYMQN